MPRFSIVIPTTRPRLLPWALESVLSQTFSDFEVVVSDNSAEGCRNVLDAFPDPRVRYVRPDERMDVTPHWDYAVSHAVGDWLVMLCDDDAILPVLLAAVDKAIRSDPTVDAIKWQHSAFYRVQSAPGEYSLSMPGFCGREKRYKARDLVGEMFDCGTGLFRVKHNLPFFPLAACKRQSVEAARRNQEGRIFHPPCPMTSGVLAVLAFSRNTLVLDLPLTVLGDPPDSAGNMANDDNAYREMHRGVELSYAPIKSMRVFPSVNAESLLRTQAALSEYLSEFRLNMPRYFLACALAIRQVAGGGTNVSRERALFDEALALQSSEVQSEYLRLMNREVRSVPYRRSQIRGVLRNLRKVAGVAKRAALPAKGPVFAKWRSDEIDVHNVLDAAKYVDDVVRPYSMA